MNVDKRTKMIIFYKITKKKKHKDQSYQIDTRDQDNNLLIELFGTTNLEIFLTQTKR